MISPYQGPISAGEIGTDAITTDKIAASAVTAAKLRASSLDYVVYKGIVSGSALSAAGCCSLATPGFTPGGVIAVPLGKTSIAFCGCKTILSTSKATLAFRTATATGFMKATSTTITFYYEYRRP